MNKRITLKERLRNMAYLMIGMMTLKIIGYVVCVKLIADAKDKYHHSVAMVIRLDQVDISLRDLTIALQDSSGQQEIDFSKIKSSATEMKDTLFELRGNSTNDSYLTLLTRSGNLLADKLVPVTDKWQQIRKQGVKNSFSSFQSEYAPVRAELTDLISELKSKALLEAKNYGDQQSYYGRLTSVLFGLILFISTALVLFSFRRLSIRIMTVLKGLAAQLSTSIESVQDACKNIDSASRQVASSATEHASAIEETAASMEEMTAMVAQASTNAANSLGVAKESQKQVENGKEIIAQMNVAMQQIQMANTKLNSILQIISDIRNKTKIINDIVFETRLLSFNASIEAARAGVHGKGFAVVAEEVGKLASLSGKAADEIRSLLDSSVTEVNQIIGTTLDKVSSAKTVSEQCEGAFYAMAEAMRKIADAMDSITTAAGQQEQGIRETNKAMMDISHVTQKNTASGEKMLAQVASLSELVQVLTGWVVNLSEFLYGIDHQSSKSGENSTGYSSKYPTEYQGYSVSSLLKRVSEFAHPESGGSSPAAVEKRGAVTSLDDSDAEDDSALEQRPILRSDERWSRKT